MSKKREAPSRSVMTAIKTTTCSDSIKSLILAAMLIMMITMVPTYGV
jgi:hypothetical protein